MAWLKTHAYLFAWLWPIAVLIIVRLKKVPEGKSVNWARQLIGTLTLFGWAFLLTPQQNPIFHVAALLLIAVGMGCMMAIPPYNKERVSPPKGSLAAQSEDSE